jgi:hypothetical protein
MQKTKVARVVLGAAGIALLSAWATGCEFGVEDPTLASAESAVVYGIDNRQDVYAYPVQAWRDRATTSAVALIPAASINTTNPSNVTFVAPTLQQNKNLCPGERFADQPTAAFCSGTLIDDDKVLTAGHCVTKATQCASTRIVFNYDMVSDTQLATVTSADVFKCAKIVTRVQTATMDYGILQLDRPATPRFTPAPVRRQQSSLATGDGLVVMGCGSGLPVKLDDGGSVRDPRASALDYFVANMDTFGGNSGSGVYLAATGEVAGILVRGETDYVPDAQAGCNRVNVCTETGCAGEDSTYAFRAVNAMCGVTTSARLCGPFCGNGKCETGETNAACPADCPAVPTSWKCSAANYGTGDGCHCNCGAPDPDCIATPTPAIGCKKGFVCSAAGTCTK